MSCCSIKSILDITSSSSAVINARSAFSWFTKYVLNTTSRQCWKRVILQRSDRVMVTVGLLFCLKGEKRRSRQFQYQTWENSHNEERWKGKTTHLFGWRTRRLRFIWSLRLKKEREKKNKDGLKLQMHSVRLHERDCAFLDTRGRRKIKKKASLKSVDILRSHFTTLLSK